MAQSRITSIQEFYEIVTSRETKLLNITPRKIIPLLSQ